jgi:hypothetical protein
MGAVQIAIGWSAVLLTLVGGCTRLGFESQDGGLVADRGADVNAIVDLVASDRQPVDAPSSLDAPQLDAPLSDKAQPDKAQPDKALPDKALPDKGILFANNLHHPLTIVAKSAVLPVNSTQTTFAFRPGATYGALAFHSSGDLYVLEHTGGSVDRITPGGVVSTFATNVGGSYWSRLAFDALGNLYVSKLAVIKKITPTGTVSDLSVSNPNTPFSYITGLAFDGADNLYAADINTGIVHRIDPAGKATEFGKGFSFAQIYALTFLPSGDLLVNGSKKMFKVTPTGAISTPFSTGNRNIYEQGVLDGAGNLYLPLRELNGTSGWNGKGFISRFTLAGAETPFVPTLGAFSTNPLGLSMDSNGRLYASVGNAIRRYAP